LFIKKVVNKTMFLSETSFRPVSRGWCRINFALRGKSLKYLYCTYTAPKDCRNIA